VIVIVIGFSKDGEIVSIRAVDGGSDGPETAIDAVHRDCRVEAGSELWASREA
jgi:hypothetical protein